MIYTTTFVNDSDINSHANTAGQVAKQNVSYTRCTIPMFVKGAWGFGVMRKSGRVKRTKIDFCIFHHISNHYSSTHHLSLGTGTADTGPVRNGSAPDTNNRYSEHITVHCTKKFERAPTAFKEQRGSVSHKKIRCSHLLVHVLPVPGSTITPHLFYLCC